MPESSSQLPIFDDSASTASSELSDIDPAIFDDEEVAVEVSNTRKRSTKSDVWLYHREPLPHEKKRHGKNKIFYCKLCTRSYTNNTSARRHLRAEHQILVEELLRQPAIQKDRQQSLHESLLRTRTVNQAIKERKDAEVLRTAINEELLNEAMIKLVVSNSLPLNSLSWPHLQALLVAINYTVADVLPASRRRIPALIERTFIRDKEYLKQRLQNAISKIHFSVDMWTSPNKKAFLAIVAHFVDEAGEIKKALLALPQLRGSHGGELQAEFVNRAIDEYGIASKIGYITADNHGANDKLCRFVSQHLESYYKIDWPPEPHRIRCQGHVVNLSAQAYLFCTGRQPVEEALRETEAEDKYDEVEEDNADIAIQKKASKNSLCRVGVLSKLHRLATWIRSSELLYNEFIDTVGRTIPMDNETRWNSWYMMAKVSLENRDRIVNFCEKHYRRSNIFIENPEWQDLEQICKFLYPYYRVTLSTQGDLDSIEKTIYTMDLIFKHCQTKLRSTPPESIFYEAIQAAWAALDAYYRRTDDVTAYAAALLLNPSRRKAYINKVWDKSWIQPAVNRVTKLWQDEYMDRDVHRAEDREVEREATPPNEADEFDLLREQLDVIEYAAARTDQLTDFINSRPIQISGSALQWWIHSQQRSAYPQLSQMAIDLLSIPAMSAEAERIFSGARRTISWERSRLGGLRIEQMECLKHWFKNSTIEAEYSLTTTLRDLNLVDDRRVANITTSSPTTSSTSSNRGSSGDQGNTSSKRQKRKQQA